MAPYTFQGQPTPAAPRATTPTAVLQTLRDLAQTLVDRNAPRLERYRAQDTTVRAVIQSQIATVARQANVDPGLLQDEFNRVVATLRPAPPGPTAPRAVGTPTPAPTPRVGVPSAGIAQATPMAAPAQAAPVLMTKPVTMPKVQLTDPAIQVKTPEARQIRQRAEPIIQRTFDILNAMNTELGQGQPIPLTQRLESLGMRAPNQTVEETVAELLALRVAIAQANGDAFDIRMDQAALALEFARNMDQFARTVTVTRSDIQRALNRNLSISDRLRVGRIVDSVLGPGVDAAPFNVPALTQALESAMRQAGMKPGDNLVHLAARVANRAAGREELVLSHPPGAGKEDIGAISFIATALKYRDVPLVFSTSTFKVSQQMRDNPLMQLAQSVGVPVQFYPEETSRGQTPQATAGINIMTHRMVNSLGIEHQLNTGMFVLTDEVHDAIQGARLVYGQPKGIYESVIKENPKIATVMQAMHQTYSHVYQEVARLEQEAIQSGKPSPIRYARDPATGRENRNSFVFDTKLAEQIRKGLNPVQQNFFGGRGQPDFKEVINAAATIVRFNEGRHYQLDYNAQNQVTGYAVTDANGRPMKDTIFGQNAMAAFLAVKHQGSISMFGDAILNKITAEIQYPEAIRLVGGNISMTGTAEGVAPTIRALQMHQVQLVAEPDVVRPDIMDLDVVKGSDGLINRVVDVLGTKGKTFNLFIVTDNHLGRLRDAANVLAEQVKTNTQLQANGFGNNTKILTVLAASNDAFDAEFEDARQYIQAHPMEKIIVVIQGLSSGSNIARASQDLGARGLIVKMNPAPINEVGQTAQRLGIVDTVQGRMKGWAAHW
ncbi:MAG: hypothetical protein HYY57_02555, partial [Candidatus Omnitrophica bacterium]|nr:hypothetical protein [Candidatus Omnitrophota bacterium]